MSKNNERLEDLQCNGLKIFQNKDLYCFSSDSVVLANFVKAKANNRAVEIGTGCGVISVLVQAKNTVGKIFAFEIQPEMADLARKNVDLNNLENKIEIIEDDVNNFENYLERESVDLVFSNPPFFKKTNFEQSKTKKIAKEEVCLNCESLVKVVSKMLKFGGRFYCCFASDRVCELVSLCQKNNLKIKELFFTENGKGEVKLAVIKAVKGGKEGVKVFPNLVTNEKDGKYLEKLTTKNFIS